VQRLGVDLRLNSSANRALVSTLAADAVIVATGARVAVADVPGARLPHVLPGPVLRQVFAGAQLGLVGPQPFWAMLARYLPAPVGRRLQPRHVRAVARRWLPFGKRVCVVGDDLVALELAEFLQRLGRRVSLLTQARVPALDVGPKRRQEQLARFDRLGGEVLAECELQSITAVEVIFRCGERKGRLPADSVVLAGTPCSDATLADDLQGVAPQVFSIGDCTGPGLIAGAVIDATHAACAIGRVSNGG
jgi:2,4-dienoyl-CoA reductase (NADPH2)